MFSNKRINTGLIFGREGNYTDLFGMVSVQLLLCFLGCHIVDDMGPRFKCLNKVCGFQILRDLVDKSSEAECDSDNLGSSNRQAIEFRRYGECRSGQQTNTKASQGIGGRCEIDRGSVSLSVTVTD